MGQRLITPGETDVDVDWMPYQLAFPVSCAVNTPDGVKLCIVGGLSPLAHGALTIAAGLAASAAPPDEIAKRAVEVALAVLKKAEPIDAALSLKQQEAANARPKRPLIEDN